MERFNNNEIFQTEKSFYTNTIESNLKLLNLKNDFFIEEYKNDPKVIERLTNAERIAKKMENDNPKHPFYAESGFESAMSLVEGIFYDEEQIEVLKQKLENEIIVDLGCGTRQSWTPLIAKAFKSSLYIGIEKYLDLDELELKRFELELKNKNQTRLKKFELELKNNTQTNFIFSKQDMLMFVSTLPDNSVNFIISGIDDIIIPDEKYWEALEIQIRRSLKPKGVIITGGMPIFANYAKKELGYNDLVGNDIRPIFEIKK